MKPVLDFFYALGSSRDQDLTDLFNASLEYSVDLTARSLLWSRDIREGAGERQHFKTHITSLISHLPNTDKLIELMPGLGRFDDYQALWGTELEEKAAKAWVKAIQESHALAAKWAPRKDKQGAKPLRKAARMSEKEWRRLVAFVSDTVEQKLCAKQYDQIDYSKLPSKASIKYQGAFNRNDATRYAEYLNGLASGETKANAGALYPYEIIANLSLNPQLAEAQWLNQPKWDFGDDTLAIIDVSPSMEERVANTTAKNIAISLGIYAAENCTGAFKNFFISFHSEPTLVELDSSLSLEDKVNLIKQAPWGTSTNIQAVFRLILRQALLHRITQSEMPKRILIVSDMQFDECMWKGGNIYQKMGNKFKEHGYELPTIVFWQVNSKAGGMPVSIHESGAALVSGFSPSIVRGVLGNNLDPESVMLEILMSDRYQLAS